MSLLVLFIGFSVIGLKFGFAEGCRVQMTPRLIIARFSAATRSYTAIFCKTSVL